MPTPNNGSGQSPGKGSGQSPYKGAGGIMRIVGAMRNSFAGLAGAVRGEDAFRQELALAAILVPLAFWVGRSGFERALLIGSVLLVLIVELVNSAIEATVDRISLEIHPLAKRAKDLGSAAVLLALVCAGATWLLVLRG
jgi:diacylglycerol kinase (ATP)